MKPVQRRCLASNYRQDQKPGTKTGQSRAFLLSLSLSPSLFPLKHIFLLLVVVIAALTLYVQVLAQAPASLAGVSHTKLQIEGLLDGSGRLVADDSQRLNGLTAADILSAIPPSGSGGGAGRERYESPGTYSFKVPDGVVEVWITAVGGGGGGGSGEPTFSIASGINGGQSCFGSICAKGGFGGSGATPAGYGGSGGAPGGLGGTAGQDGTRPPSGNSGPVGAGGSGGVSPFVGFGFGGRAGNGGRHCDVGTSAGAGGGGGGGGEAIISRKVTGLTPGSTVTVTVGAGGASGVAAGTGCPLGSPGTEGTGGFLQVEWFASGGGGGASSTQTSWADAQFGGYVIVDVMVDRVMGACAEKPTIDSICSSSGYGLCIKSSEVFVNGYGTEYTAACDSGYTLVPIISVYDDSGCVRMKTYYHCVKPTAFKQAGCGDGIVQAGEACDDGNRDDRIGNCKADCSKINYFTEEYEYAGISKTCPADFTYGKATIQADVSSSKSTTRFCTEQGFTSVANFFAINSEAYAYWDGSSWKCGYDIDDRAVIQEVWCS